VVTSVNTDRGNDENAIISQVTSLADASTIGLSYVSYLASRMKSAAYLT
jgi:hypothetical protein